MTLLTEAQLQYLIKQFQKFKVLVAKKYFTLTAIIILFFSTSKLLST